ncbi:MAG: GAF domain-containing protein, partial [bacterium]
DESFEKESLIIIPDIQEETRILPNEIAKESGPRTVCIVPLTVQKEPFGGLYLFHSEPREFTSEYRYLAETLGDLVSLAIEKDQLFGHSGERSSRLTALNELTRKITENLSLDEVLKNIVQAAVELLGGDHSRIFLYDSQSQILFLAAQNNVGRSSITQSYSYAVGEGLTGKVFQKREPIRESDVPNCPGWVNGEWAQRRNIRSFIAHPLLSTNKAVGVINCQSTETDFFHEEDLELLGALASQAAVAIQNARLHEEAQRSRNFFRSVVEDNADAIIVTDKDRRILWWNAGAEKLYGYNEAEALGNSVVDLIAPPSIESENDPLKEKDINQTLLGGRSIQAEVMRCRKDGTLVPVDLTLSPVKDDEGNVIALCGITKDLTQRMNSEEALKEAKEAAEAANKTKGEFLSNVSHELRSPLNAVIGFSDLLLMSTKDEEALRLLPKIRSAGKYLSRLIDDLRDVDRIETGKMQLEFAEVSVNDLIQNLIESRTAHLPEEFTLEQKLDPACESVTCDPTRISQIINNLLDNSVKYSPEGGTIRVRSQKQSSEIWISVQDNGLGIGSDMQEIIFDRFQQLGNPTRGSSGLGIGLYLVRHILSLHGGRIWVDSQPYKGSTFTFSLPCESTEKAAPATGTIPADAPPSRRNEPWDGRKVLLVDDLEMFHEYIGLLMKNTSGFISAYNGQEGVEAARLERPDLILMDLRMPILDGFESIKQLKSDPETKEIPIVAVTAQAMEQDRKLSLDLGANGFVTKPVDLNLLRQEIERVLSPAKE